MMYYYIEFFFSATTIFLHPCHHTGCRHRFRRRQRQRRRSARTTWATATTRTTNRQYRRIGTRGLTCGCRNHHENIATERPAEAAAVVAVAITGIIIDTAVNRRSSQRAIIWWNRMGRPERWKTRTSSSSRTARTRNLWNWRVTTTATDIPRRTPGGPGRSRGRP